MCVYICVCQQLVVITQTDIDGSRQQVSKTLVFNSTLIGITAQENFSAFICHDNFQF